MIRFRAFPLLPLFLLACLVLAGTARAQTVGNLTVNADSSSRDTELDIIELDGNVQIIYGDQHLQADRALISLRAKTIDAQGNVTLTSPQATIGGTKALLDYESSTGVIYDGYVKNGNMLFEGNYVIKTGEKDYLAETARFSTCSNCPESWSFGGTRIRAELGGYAYIKNATLRVAGFPVFWLPYLIVPLKSDRQTGLLTPEFGTSDAGGLMIGQSLFWVISPSQDATFTLRNYEFRGPMGLVNYRYMLNADSYGEMNATSIRDRAFGVDSRLNDFRTVDKGTPINRWLIDYNHYHAMPEGFTHRLQIANAADLQYPKDFITRHHGEPAMENRMSLSKALEKDNIYVDSAYYLNLLQANPLASNNDAVHKLPEISYSRIKSPLGIGRLFYDWNFNYTNFARSEFAWDDMNCRFDDAACLTAGKGRHLVAAGPATSDCNKPDWQNDPTCTIQRDGTFDPDKDIIRTGQRLDFNGSLMRSFNLGRSFELMPTVQYRETQYRFQIENYSYNVRRYVRTDLALRTTLSGFYDGGTKDTPKKYKHEIMPELTYTTIPWFDHPSHPFFGAQNAAPYIAQPSLMESDILQPYGVPFDYNDRIFDRKLVTFAITNKLIQKKFLPGAPEYRQNFYWRLAQSYDLYQDEIGLERKQSLSDISSEFKVNLDDYQMYQKVSYSPVYAVFDGSTRVRYTNKRGDFVQVQHDIVHNKIPTDITRRSTEDYTFLVRRSARYIDFLGRATLNAIPQPNQAGVPLKSVGYGAQFKLPGECWNFTIVQVRTTEGGNSTDFLFDFAWAGKPVPVLPEDLLSRYPL